MEFIKRKISLEELTSRKADSTWGTITEPYIYLNVFISQNYDDMGIFTDYPYIQLNGTTPDYSILENKLISEGYNFPFMSGDTVGTIITATTYTARDINSGVTDYYINNGTLTAETDSKITYLESYDVNNPYKLNFDIEKGVYNNFEGVQIDGRSRVTDITNPYIYVIDTNLDINIGTSSQTSGFLYGDYEIQDYPNTPLFVNNIITTVQFQSEGFNETNTSLSALTKVEYLLGITETPRVDDDVVIDRGDTSPLESHLRLVEIDTLDQLTTYANGFYNIIKQSL